MFKQEKNLGCLHIQYIVLFFIENLYKTNNAHILKTERIYIQLEYFKGNYPLRIIL